MEHISEVIRLDGKNESPRALRSVAHELASITDALKRCKASNNAYASKHEMTLAGIVSQYLPHGSGIDGKVWIDTKRSTAKKIVITFDFHCMDSNGFYSGWREYSVIVQPDFDGLDVRITGRDYNGVKDYLHELFSSACSAPCRAYFHDGLKFVDYVTENYGLPGQRQVWKEIESARICGA